MEPNSRMFVVPCAAQPNVQPVYEAFATVIRQNWIKVNEHEKSNEFIIEEQDSGKEHPPPTKKKPRKSQPQLPAELWAHIFHLAAGPAMGSSKQSMLQFSLVSKYFNYIVTPIIYHSLDFQRDPLRFFKLMATLDHKYPGLASSSPSYSPVELSVFNFPSTLTSFQTCDTYLYSHIQHLSFTLCNLSFSLFMYGCKRGWFDQLKSLKIDTKDGEEKIKYTFSSVVHWHLPDLQFVEIPVLNRRNWHFFKSLCLSRPQLKVAKVIMTTKDNQLDDIHENEFKQVFDNAKLKILKFNHVRFNSLDILGESFLKKLKILDLHFESTSSWSISDIVHHLDNLEALAVVGLLPSPHLQTNEDLPVISKEEIEKKPLLKVLILQQSFISDEELISIGNCCQNLHTFIYAAKASTGPATPNESAPPSPTMALANKPFSVTDEGLSAFFRSMRNLKVVGLDEINLSKSTLETLLHTQTQLTSLKTFFRSAHHSTSDHLWIGMDKALENVQLLDLRNEDTITEEALVKMVPFMSSLEHLYLSDYISYSAEFFELLAKHCPELQTLCGYYDSMTVETMDRLLLSHPHLTQLGLLWDSADSETAAQPFDPVKEGLDMQKYNRELCFEPDVASRCDVFSLRTVFENEEMRLLRSLGLYH